MIDIKRFNGVLNTDDRPEDILNPQHISAKNIRFYGGQNGLTAQNIKGNYVIPNNNLPAGTNECIGSFFDSVKQRIIWFNYNSNGDNGIYQLSIQNGTVSPIFICGTNSATDILNFSLDYPVHSVNIVYRTTGDGDLLYWTDGYNRPKYLNLDTVSSLSPFTEDMITAAKNAPLSPPILNYENDSTKTINNLRKKLFRSSYRWVYKNGEKSTFSPISKVPLPVGGYTPTIDNDSTKNNNIKINITAGGDDYSAIEIVGQFNIDNIWGDFFLIDKLDRNDYGILPNTTYNYYFYNDGAYVNVDPQETDLYYSWIPDKANTLELLNGNVIIYGGLTDGYDKILRSDIDVTVSVASGNPNIPTISYAYSGINVISVLIGPIIQNFAVYSIQFDYVSGAGGDASPKNVSYTTTPGNTQDNIGNSLAALLNGNNITATYLGSGLIRIATTGFLPGSSITNVSVGVSISGSEIASSAWKWNYSGRLGLIYFDVYGKTNGVVSFVSENSLDNTDFSFNTPNFSTNSNVPQVPIVSASINHLPPSWAVAYQWVRANSLPTQFLYWITNDYQFDSNYLYLCIQNLTYTSEKTSGFVPSYEFEKGDRVRVLASYTGNTYAAYTSQLDMEILGVEERTMNAPNLSNMGTFIKVAKPTSFPTYQQQMLIELYTPKPKSNDKSLFFYEWGEKYNIYELSGVNYHRGQITDQTASQPATFEWFDGDVYYHPRSYYVNPDISTVNSSEYFIDANYNDYFQSAVNSNGRFWPIDENAKEEYNPVLVRWGGKYEPGTNINNLSIFRPSDFDEVDRIKGDIRRFKTRDRILRVFQDRGVGQYGIYSRFIQNNSGQSELVTTNEIITTNNIQYYIGSYGLGGYPTNLCSSAKADYFNDIITGHGIRLASDGITDLGLSYKGQFYFPSLITPYSKQLLQTNGKIAKVMGYWDSLENEWHTIIQGGSANGTITTDKNWSFNETRNGYCCDDYGFVPEWALSANNIVYSWKNGAIYKHDSTTYCNFYGVQDSCDIKVVFNRDLLLKKSWNAISEVSSTIWSCPEIYTNTKSYGSQKQETNIVEQEFRLLEDMPSASIKRDVNSVGGKINGDFMKGNYMVVKFEKQNASELVTLNEISMRYTISFKTDR